jgi:GT2 family glycosyltransferase
MADHLVSVSGEPAGAEELFHEERGGWAGGMDRSFMAAATEGCCSESLCA